MIDTMSIIFHFYINITGRIEVEIKGVEKLEEEKSSEHLGDNCPCKSFIGTCIHKAESKASEKRITIHDLEND